MSKKASNKKLEMDSLTYLKRVKGLGIFGIILSIGLIIYDAYMFENWVSIVSLVVDGLLLIFSIYFIIKSSTLKKREIIAIEKNKKRQD